MAGGSGIAPRRPIGAPGRAVVGRKCVVWPRSLGCVEPSPPSSPASGRRNRSRAGFAPRFRAILTCRCHTKRSIAPCSSRVAGCSNASYYKHLRRERRFRHARAARRVGHRQGHIIDAVSIRERPADVADRAVPGHWEGDLLVGGRSSYVATLVERQSRYVVLVRLPNKETATVVRALAKRVQRLPQGLMTSLTSETGPNSPTIVPSPSRRTWPCYSAISKAPGSVAPMKTRMACYRRYCPRAPTARRSARRSLMRSPSLNTRPRLTLGFQTPAAKLAEIVASTS